MAKKIPTTEEQVARQPRRPHVSPEWLTKLSSAEFWEWCDTQANIMRFRGGTSREAIQLHLETEIKNQEQLYQYVKENRIKPKDIKLGDKLTGTITLTASTKNYITYDIQTLPSNRNAVLRRDKYAPVEDYKKQLFK